jgi:hypothetical protein
VFSQGATNTNIIIFGVTWDIKGKPIDDIVQEISHVIITWIRKTLVIEPKRTKKQSSSQKKLKQT